jgi:hypothetical protein
VRGVYREPVMAASPAWAQVLSIAPEGVPPTADSRDDGPHEQEMDARAIACFDQALEDVGLAGDGRLRQVLHDYFAWATSTTMARYHRSADDVPDGLPIPQWSRDGLVTSTGPDPL